MNTIKLKIKIKSLAEESRIIRRQEQKMRGKNWGPKSAVLREHRLCVVRPASRDTHVAYGYLRGRTYAQLEGSAKTQPNWSAILKMVRSYGVPQITEKDLVQWKLGAVVSLAA